MACLLEVAAAGCVARARYIKACGVRPLRSEHCFVCNGSLSATLAPVVFSGQPSR